MKNLLTNDKFAFAKKVCILALMNIIVLSLSVFLIVMKDGELRIGESVFFQSADTSVSLATKKVSAASKEPKKVSSFEELASKYAPYDTPHNRMLLAKIIASEYRSQDINDMDKKLAVGIVVMNRVLHPHFPDSVEKVIFQRNQFQPTFDGTWEKIRPTSYDELIVDKLFEGYMVTTENGEPLNHALYFLNPDISDPKNVAWFKNKLDFIGSMGEHDFYGER